MLYFMLKQRMMIHRLLKDGMLFIFLCITLRKLLIKSNRKRILNHFKQGHVFIAKIWGMLFKNTFEGPHTFHQYFPNNWIPLQCSYFELQFLARQTKQDASRTLGPNLD